MADRRRNDRLRWGGRAVAAVELSKALQGLHLGDGGAIVAYPTRSNITKASGLAVWDTVLFGRVARAWARGLAGLRQ